ncbi:MAG: peroxiredoxin family protein [Phycisphaerales bacterium]
MTRTVCRWVRGMAWLALMAAAAGGVRAQEVEAKPDGTPKPDASAIMHAADVKLGKVKSLAFLARALPVGVPGAILPSVEATVRMERREKDEIGWTFEVRGKATDSGGERELAAAYDGKVVRSVRTREQRVVESPAELYAEPMADGSGMVTEWVLRWGELVHGPFGAAGEQGPARHEGTAMVEGEACDVIYVDYSESNDPTLFDAWWYMAKSDALPRRVDVHRVDPSRGDGFVVVTISGLEVDVPVGPMALAVPEGYEKKVVEAPERKPVGRVVRGGLGVGAVAPDWVLKDAEGKEHRLSDYRGKVVVMDFWATWCGPCIMAMPGMQKLHEKYAKAGAVVLGLNCWENEDPAKFMAEKGFTYGLLVKADEVAAKYEVSGIPTFYVVGKDGKIVYVERGYNPEGEETIGKIIEGQGK